MKKGTLLYTAFTECFDGKIKVHVTEYIVSSVNKNRIYIKRTDPLLTKDKSKRIDSDIIAAGYARHRYQALWLEADRLTNRKQRNIAFTKTIKSNRFKHLESVAAEYDELIEATMTQYRRERDIHFSKKKTIEMNNEIEKFNTTPMCWHPLARKLQRSPKMPNTKNLNESADSGLPQPRFVRCWIVSRRYLFNSWPSEILAVFDSAEGAHAYKARMETEDSVDPVSVDSYEILSANDQGQPRARKT